MDNAIFDRFNGVSDDEFLDLLIRAEREPIIEGVRMPGFPDLEFQKNSVGSRGAKDLKLEPFQFTKAVRKSADQFGILIDKDTRILDFGVGWGRMIRFFFKDILSDNIHGTDVWKMMIDYCNQLLPAGRYSVNSPHPPIGFADDTFDIIYAYSVFSHLRSDVAEAWIKEFSRILKPNGIVVATTEGEYFLGVCERLQNNPDMQAGNPWYPMIARAFDPISEFQKRYSDGEFLYVPTGGGDALDSSFYGDAVVPERFIKDVFGIHLLFREFTQFDKNDSLLPQARFVLQKETSQ